MLFIITEHATCNVCKEKMRGRREWKPKWERLDGHFISLLLFLLVLLVHSQDHHEFSEESNEV